MPVETPPAATAPAQPSAKDELYAAIQKGFALKQAGKLTTDDPDPTTPPPATPPAPPPSPVPRQAPPSPVAERPASPAPATEADPKRTATAQDWATVNADRDNLRAELETLKAEKARNGATPQNTEEITQLKAKLTEYDTILRQVAAERHPDLIGPINQRIAAALKLAQSAVPKEQAEDIAKILKQPDGEERDTQLDSILEGLSTTKRARLIKAMTDIEEANAARGQLAEHSQQALTAREQAIRQRHEKNLAEFDAEASDWTDPAHGIELLIEKPGDVGHNERRNAILANAKALFSGQVSSPRDLARAAIWSAFGETLNRQNLALLQEVSKLNSEITKLKGGTPGLNGAGAAPGEGENPDEKPKGMSTAEWIVRQAQKEGVKFGSAY